MLHGVALVVFGYLAWLMLDRLLPGPGDTTRALVFGVVLSLIALGLYGSLRHHADAPTRALAHRSPDLPARDPDASMQPDYSTIVMVVLFLLFAAAIGTRQPRDIHIVVAVVAVLTGVFLAIRRRRFDRVLTVAQRERLRDQRIAARETQRTYRRQPGAVWRGALLLVFVGIELAMLSGGILLGVGIAQAIAGPTSGNAGFGVFMLGFLPGLAIGGLLFWPLERLCKRWTGHSAVHAFDGIPPGW